MRFSGAEQLVLVPNAATILLRGRGNRLAEEHRLRYQVTSKLDSLCLRADIVVLQGDLCLQP